MRRIAPLAFCFALLGCDPVTVEPDAGSSDAGPPPVDAYVPPDAPPPPACTVQITRPDVDTVAAALCPASAAHVEAIVHPDGGTADAGADGGTCPDAGACEAAARRVVLEGCPAWQLCELGAGCYHCEGWGADPR